MNTPKLNDWLTLLTNIAVVAGIVFLAVEIRQNTASLDESRKQVRLQSFQTYLQNLDESQRALANSPYMAEIFVKYEKDGAAALSDVEMQRFRWQSSTGMHRLDTLHYLNEIGYGDPERYESVMRTTGCEHAKRWKEIGIWPDRPSFREAMDDLLKNRCK